MRIHLEEYRAMSNRRWSAAALLAVLLGLLTLMLSGTVRVGAGQVVDRNKSAEKPVPASKETSAARRADMVEVRKITDAFSQAYNKGDLDALLGFWTEDAEFIRESGKTYTGREAIRSLLKGSLADNKGSKQAIRVSSVRFIRPDVVSAAGVVTLTTPDGEVDTGRYTGIFVKQGGKWLISSIRDLPDTADDDKATATSRLKQLAWLVGEWQERGTKAHATMSVRWGPGQTFLIQRFTVKHADGKESQSTQRIGWDPHEERIRSWLFDSSGGFAGGYWTRTGNTWEEESSGVLADGQVSTSINTWKFVDNNTAEWTAKEREADEAPLQDLHVTFVRKQR
jgi:uncharacterized protein (TIGR02246 family)